MVLPTQEAQSKGITLPPPINPKALRLEIDEFTSDGDVLNLFLLALVDLQNNDRLRLPKLKEGEHPTAKQKEDYWWSFYNISTLHGVPYSNDWNHAHESPQRNADPGKPLPAWPILTQPLPQQKPNTGYCSHGKLTFPSWHRPYMFMLEQAIFNKMHEIAEQYPETWRGGQPCRQKYLDAADKFRLPYWDPWMPRNYTNSAVNWSAQFEAPAILKAQEVFVRRPTAVDDLEGIANPMYTYKLPFNGSIPKPARVNWNDFLENSWQLSEGTLRAPTSTRANKSNDAILDWKIRNQAVNSTEKFISIFINLGLGKSIDWENFSNHGHDYAKAKREGTNQAEVSIESWHDDIHVLVGAGSGNSAGNMGNAQIASFDPVFYLHHCNVDRIFALYQALHPDQYVPEQPPAPDRADEVLDAPLKPFWKGEGMDDYWTSRDARDWKRCGFGVPGVQDVDPEQLKKTVGEYLRYQYGWVKEKKVPPENFGFPVNLDHVEAFFGGGKAPEAKNPKVPTNPLTVTPVGEGASVKIVQQVTPFASNPNKEVKQQDQALPSTTTDAAEKGQQREWDVHLTVRQFYFDGSFNVDFFFGKVDDSDAGNYLLEPNQIGFCGVFTSSGTETGCENCERQRAAGVRYADTVPLTSMLKGVLTTNNDPRGLPHELRTLKSLEAEDVVPYLKENLEWRISLINGTPKKREDVKNSDLEVKVMDRIYYQPSDGYPLGKYGDLTLHEEITSGKIGGYPKEQAQV